MSEFQGFRPAALRFLRDLSRNNTKTWFEDNRGVYEREVREPMLGLIEALDARLARFAPEITGSARRSMFRIHRDVRFTRDKSPYKTNAGCWLYHRGASRHVGRDSEGGSAGFYFHLEPGRCLVAGGLWMPPRSSLSRVRQAIDGEPRALPRLLRGRRLQERFGALDDGARLGRVPRDYAADHPAAEWLKYQSFTLSAPVESGALGSARLVDLLAADFAALLPLVRWLNSALGFPPAKSRS